MFDNSLLSAAFSRSMEEPSLEGLDKAFQSEEEVAFEALEKEVAAFQGQDGSLAMMEDVLQEIQAVRDAMTLQGALSVVAEYGQTSSAEMVLSASNAWLAHLDQSITIPVGTADDKRHEVAMEGLMDVLKSIGNFISASLKKVLTGASKLFTGIGDAFRSQGGLAVKLKERIASGKLKTGSVKSSMFSRLSIDGKEVDLVKEYDRLKAEADDQWEGANFDKMIDPVLKGTMDKVEDMFQLVTKAQLAALKIQGITKTPEKEIWRGAGPNARTLVSDKFIGSSFIAAQIVTVKNSMFPNGRDRVTAFNSLSGYEGAGKKVGAPGELRVLTADQFQGILDKVIESAKWVDEWSQEWFRYDKRQSEIWQAVQNLAAGWKFDENQLEVLISDISMLCYVMTDGLVFSAQTLWVTNNSVNSFVKECLE